jgi:hypothetical protein
MPWTTKAAQRHTRKARTPKSKRQWSKVANSMLKRTGDEGAAIRAANAAVAKRKGGHVMARRKRHGKKGRKR